GQTRHVQNARQNSLWSLMSCQIVRSLHLLEQFKAMRFVGEESGCLELMASLAEETELVREVLQDQGVQPEGEPGEHGSGRICTGKGMQLDSPSRNTIDADSDPGALVTFPGTTTIAIRPLQTRHYQAYDLLPIICCH